MNSNYLTQVKKVFPPVGDQGRSHGTSLENHFPSGFCLFVCLFFNEYEYIAEVKISFLCDLGGQNIFSAPHAN